MQNVLLIVQLIIAVALIITVLLQRSEGGALGIGGSGSGLGGLFSQRGAANTLTQTTAFLAAAFFIISIVLNVLALQGHKTQSILDTAGSLPSGQTVPVKRTNDVPVVPTGPAPAPAAPAPQAPQKPSVPPSH
jgi:preprotein translocase subunit SecG